MNHRCSSLGNKILVFDAHLNYFLVGLVHLRASAPLCKYFFHYHGSSHLLALWQNLLYQLQNNAVHYGVCSISQTKMPHAVSLIMEEKRYHAFCGRFILVEIHAQRL